MSRFLALTLVLLSAAGCRGSSAASKDDNPPAPGFNAAGSDAKAVAIADDVMRAMGGRKAWDSTCSVAWNFFGKRSHVWDKCNGDYKLVDGDRTVRMNLTTMKGRVWDKGTEVKDPAEVEQALKKAHSIWINDSYWLLMPYKLKDSGVTLKYGGEAKLPDERAADKLVMTFDKVGDTPQNKYEVLVARDTHLVEQWSYFDKASDEKPKIITPWSNWKSYGHIKLSGDRAPDKSLTDIAVYDAPPPELAEAH